MEIGLEKWKVHMTSNPRMKTKYPGVFYREADRIGTSGKEKIFYVVFKKDGKVVEEKVGRQFADNMSPAKAAGIRAMRIEGKCLSRKEERELAKEQQKQEEKHPSLQNLWNLYAENNRTKKSLATDGYNFKKYLSKLRNKVPDELSTSHINKLKEEVTGQGKSPQTVKHILGLVRRLIRYGAKNGLCAIPPLNQLYFDMPRIDNQKTEVLTDEELSRLLQVLDEEVDQDAASLIRLALVTGMRKGALLALRWDDCDFERSIIRLRGEAAKKGTTDYIPMNAAARRVLEQIQNHESDYVFPGRNGGQRADYRRIARRVKQKARLPEDFRPLHGLRHNFASRLASSGKVELYTLQKLLTHGSPQMTQRYAHLRDETLMKASKEAESMLGLSLLKNSDCE